MLFISLSPSHFMKKIYLIYLVITTLIPIAGYSQQDTLRMTLKHADSIFIKVPG